MTDQTHNLPMPDYPDLNGSSHHFHAFDGDSYTHDMTIHTFPVHNHALPFGESGGVTISWFGDHGWISYNPFSHPIPLSLETVRQLARLFPAIDADA